MMIAERGRRSSAVVPLPLYALYSGTLMTVVIVPRTT